jgi:hypothetical protein
LCLIMLTLWRLCLIILTLWRLCLIIPTLWRLCLIMLTLWLLCRCKLLLSEKQTHCVFILDVFVNYGCSSTDFNEVYVTRSLVLCVCFNRSLFVLLYFFFGHCVVCSSSHIRFRIKSEYYLH